MDEYMVELGGYEYAVEANSPEEARQKGLLAHVKSVGQQSVDQAVGDATTRREEALSSAPMSPWAESALAGMSGEGGAYADPNATGEDIVKRAAGMATTAGAVATGAGLATAPIAAGKALLGATAGSIAGNEAGQWAGRRLPFGLGGETASSVLGGIGSVAGGGIGGYAGPKVPFKELLSRLTTGGGSKGLLSTVLGGGEQAAAKGAATVAAKSADEIAAAAAQAERQLAMREAESAAKVLKDQARADAIKRVADARVAAIEARSAARATAPKATAPKAGPKPVPDPAPAPRTEGATALKPEPEFIDESAVSLVAEPLPFRPRGTTKPATNIGGKAKPGPEPTPPDELEATLQASIDAEKAKKAATATARPFKGSMSLEDERKAAEQFIPSQLEELATAMPKGEGPGTIAWSLGKRPRGPGDIPQVGELIANARGVAKNPDVPPDLARKLEDFAERASKPTGRLMGREHGRAEPVLPRRSILTEYIDILKDPKWETVFGSDEMLRHATKLDAKLAALRGIEKLMAR